MNKLEIKPKKIYETINLQALKVKSELETQVLKQIKKIEEHLDTTESDFPFSLLPDSMKTNHINEPTIAFDNVTRKQLYHLAQLKNIEGRSKMNKAQLYNKLKTYL